MILGCKQEGGVDLLIFSTGYEEGGGLTLRALSFAPGIFAGGIYVDGVDKKPLGTIASLLLRPRLMGSSLLYLTLFVREHGGVGKAQLLSGVKIKNQNVTEGTGQLEKANNTRHL